MRVPHMNLHFFYCHPQDIYYSWGDNRKKHAVQGYTWLKSSVVHSSVVHSSVVHSRCCTNKLLYKQGVVHPSVVHSSVVHSRCCTNEVAPLLFLLNHSEKGFLMALAWICSARVLLSLDFLPLHSGLLVRVQGDALSPLHQYSQRMLLRSILGGGGITGSGMRWGVNMRAFLSSTISS